VAVDRKTLAFFSVALAVHLALLVALPRAWRPAPPPPEEPMTWVELDDSPRARSANGESAVGSAAMRGTASRVYVAGRAAIREVEVITPGTEVAPSPDTTDTNLPSASLFNRPMSVGLDGVGSYRVDAAKQALPVPDDNAIANENTRRMLMAPITAREQANGSIASGPIVNELEASTRTLAGSPFEGRAVFSIRVDELGLVVSAQVVESSSDRRAWDEVAQHMLNAFARKRVRVPPGAKGIDMQVEITSKVVLPSGARHPLAVSSPTADGLGHVLHGQFDQPTETPAIVGGSFDLSDIGAHASRVVGAHVISETAF
jgi:hypothetical protein